MQTAVADQPAPRTASRFPLSGRSRLVVLSFLMLFVELGLIRWTAENVIYLGYFSNLILLASFLGIGAGFIRGGRARNAFAKAPVALAGLILFVSIFPVQVTKLSPEYRLGGIVPGMFALPVWIELPVIFIATVIVMGYVAQGVAKIFSEFEPLEAYKLDISGSILGILAFTALSFLGAPPGVWGLLIGLTFFTTLERPVAWLTKAAVIVIVVILAAASLVLHDRWSPYYKVTAQPREGGLVAVKVNGRPHQTIVPIEQLTVDQPFYTATYERLNGVALDDVLIIGAGTGNDVAVALAQGAKHVDAVEIDPVLNRIGRNMHPDQPYSDPRVETTITDGRAFLQNTDRRYDLILFALPDSLTLLSGHGALRLESYLFTQEAFTSARNHLKPGGVFSIYNYYSPLASERFAATLQEVFGSPPCQWLGGQYGPRREAVLIASGTPDSIACDSVWQAQGEVLEPATDDHPFPYLPGRSIPAFYLVSLILVLVASVAVVRWSAGPLHPMKQYLDLFFMGSAFLLLETKNVVQFALLFGTTWVVNALVFTGVLLAVLAAVWVAKRVRLPNPWILYGALLVSLVVAWLIPAGSLLTLPYAARFGVATVVAFTPIFLVNLVFAQRFKDVGSSTVAFGANLLGAMIGGVLEYAAMVVGYRSLLIAAAVLYGLAFLAGRRHLTAAA